MNAHSSTLDPVSGRMSSEPHRTHMPTMISDILRLITRRRYALIFTCDIASSVPKLTTIITELTTITMMNDKPNFVVLFWVRCSSKADISSDVNSQAHAGSSVTFTSVIFVSMASVRNLALIFQFRVIQESSFHIAVARWH